MSQSPAGVTSPIAVGTPLSNYSSFVDTFTQQYGVPESIAYSLANTESSQSWQYNSSSSATGFFQVLTSTAAGLGLNANDPIQNIQAGIDYLAQQFQNFGNWEQALEAYNQGPGGNLAKAKPYADTILSNSGYTGADAYPGGVPQTLSTSGAQGAEAPTTSNAIPSAVASAKNVVQAAAGTLLNFNVSEYFIRFGVIVLGLLLIGLAIYAIIAEHGSSPTAPVRAAAKVGAV